MWIIGAVLFFLISTFPTTWLLMLFLGNVGVNVSYWGSLPGGVILALLVAAGGSRMR